MPVPKMSIFIELVQGPSVWISSSYTNGIPKILQIACAITAAQNPKILQAQDKSDKS